MLARGCEANQRGQSFSIRRLGKRRQCGKRLISLGLREPGSVLKAPGRFNCRHDFFQPFAAAAALRQEME